MQIDGVQINPREWWDEHWIHDRIMSKLAPEATPAYQTRQALSLTMGWPALQENAFWNSGMFCSVPFTR